MPGKNAPDKSDEIFNKFLDKMEEQNNNNFSKLEEVEKLRGPQGLPGKDAPDNKTNI